MSTHTTRPEMERFCARTLEVSKMDTVGEHLANCPECHQLFHDVFQKRRNHAPIIINLASEKWLRDEHLDYEWLTAYVDGAMDEDELEMTKIHLELCKQCREEVADFVAWRRESASELNNRYIADWQVNPSNRFWERWVWPKIIGKPVYAFAVLVTISAAITLVILLLNSRLDSQEKQQTKVSPSPSILVSTTPILTDIPTPPPLVTSTPQVRTSPYTQPHGNRPERERPNKITPTKKFPIHLNDGNGLVAIDDSGRLIGLEKLPLDIAGSVKDVLLSGEIHRPSALTDLVANKSDLRGENNQSSFKLLSPINTVILDERPIFRWEKLSGAGSYRVYVSDSRSRKIADSGLLPPTETQWSTTLLLSRDEVYSWTVGAILDGEEVVSPSVTEPETKFKVLSAEKAHELNLLQRNTSSHLVLGVFYAQAGMLDEAEREFQQLTSDNPDSTLARRLLRTVQSWH